jgi:hypothetical protein
MRFKELDKQCVQPIERGIREAFKRSSRYSDCIKASRVTKPRFKQDGQRHKIDSVFFRCNICKDLFKPNEIDVDHLTPVVPLGLKRHDLTATELINRIWKLPIQVVCKICHKAKTKLENQSRRKLQNTLKSSN